MLLSSIKTLLEKVSPSEGFGLEKPEESLKVIEQAIDFFHDPENTVYPKEIEFEFAPAGPLQEISLSNGWNKVFLLLSEEQKNAAPPQVKQ